MASNQRNRIQAIEHKRAIGFFAVTFLYLSSSFLPILPEINGGCSGKIFYFLLTNLHELIMIFIEICFHQVRPSQLFSSISDEQARFVSWLAEQLAPTIFGSKPATLLSNNPTPALRLFSAQSA